MRRDCAYIVALVLVLTMHVICSEAQDKLWAGVPGRQPLCAKLVTPRQVGDELVYPMGDAVSAPVLTKQTKPAVPPEELDSKGTVIICGIVSRDGRIHTAAVDRSAGYGLDQIALDTVKQWEFRPATRYGSSVAAQVSLVVRFEQFTSLAIPAITKAQQNESSEELIVEFKNERVFWKQFQIANKIVALGNTRVLPELEPFLHDNDMRIRGNAGFVFAALGDERGFEIIKAILNDTSFMSPRRSGAQVTSARYYPAHLFGDLKDKRAVPILISLLDDYRVNSIIPWSLAQIGDRTAIPPLIRELSDKKADMRVLSIYALETFKAKEALPQIRLLLNDNEHIHFDGGGTVSEAATAAVAELQSIP